MANRMRARDRRSAKPQARPLSSAPQSPVQGVRSDGLHSLQQTVGNQAVQRLVVAPRGAAPPGASRSVSQRPTVQRLITKEAFYKATYAGFGSGKGKTLKQIGALLEEFHGIKKGGKHITP